MRFERAALAFAILGLCLSTLSCDPQDILGDCQITTDSFAGSYGPSEARRHQFDVGCAGTITVFWTCPQCPDPEAGRLILFDPAGGTALDLFGAGFGGDRRTVTTILEGIWTVEVRGTGESFINNYGVDVTYSAR